MAIVSENSWACEPCPCTALVKTCLLKVNGLRKRKLFKKPNGSFDTPWLITTLQVHDGHTSVKAHIHFLLSDNRKHTCVYAIIYSELLFIFNSALL